MCRAVFLLICLACTCRGRELKSPQGCKSARDALEPLKALAGHLLAYNLVAAGMHLPKLSQQVSHQDAPQARLLHMHFAARRSGILQTRASDDRPDQAYLGNENDPLPYDKYEPPKDKDPFQDYEKAKPPTSSGSEGKMNDPEFLEKMKRDALDWQNKGARSAESSAGNAKGGLEWYKQRMKARQSARARPADIDLDAKRKNAPDGSDLESALEAGDFAATDRLRKADDRKPWETEDSSAPPLAPGSSGIWMPEE